MEKQKKNDSGITLVALVVSIIVMLVLAGVSLNATIGENGIVTRAQEAVLQQKIAEDLENLNLELAKINVDTISTDETMAIQDIASYLVSQGAIDSFITTSAGQIAAGIDTATGNKYFFGTKGDNTYRITRSDDGLLTAELTTQTSGGDITGGYALITADSFNNDNTLPAEEKGKFTITDDAEVVFMDTITGALSINVADNVHATVGIYADMTLTNQGVKRSAIDISKNNGILDLYIGDGVEVTVNSGLGEEGVTATALGATGGPGGYAGIHVPLGATLKIHGSGTVIAYGGNAGAGGGAVSGNTGGGGGGGAGAGIGGRGGKGGRAGTTFDAVNRPVTNSGTNGEPAEDCGIVYIYDDVTVYAYGGNGGAGGEDQSHNSGAGGGGYPAAGIGGGGAGGGGGDHACSSGGYTAGSGEPNIVSGKNGSGSTNSLGRIGAGSGYYSKGAGSTVVSYFNQGGIWSNDGSWYKDSSGGGGESGAGGEIHYSSTSKIYAYNGNRITETNFNYSTPYYGFDNNGNLLTTGTALPVVTRLDGQKIIPAFIFAQSGTIRPFHKTNQHMTQAECTSYGVDFCSGSTMVRNVQIIAGTTTDTTGYSATKFVSYGHTANQGIGSGAGGLEKSNGTFEEL